MDLFHRRQPWYVAGLAFECRQCGRCCAGPHDGYVWMSDAEIVAVAARLGIAVEEMHRRHVRRAYGRSTLAMLPNSRDCPFLVSDGNARRSCAIYEQRPAQCRAWPFWEGNLADPSDWARAGSRCPGINRGPVHTFDEIEERRQSSSE